MRVFISYLPLPEHLRPVHVTRGGGATTLTVHPGTSRVESIAMSIDLLTPEELAWARVAWGMTPTGPVPDWCFDDEGDFVPPLQMQTLGEQRRQLARRAAELSAAG
jgi:hypothetical protein